MADGAFDSLKVTGTADVGSLSLATFLPPTTSTTIGGHTVITTIACECQLLIDMDPHSGIPKIQSTTCPFGLESSPHSPFHICLQPNGGNVGVGSLTPEQNLSINAGLNVDQASGNNGKINPGITFGSHSQEGIASQRQDRRHDGSVGNRHGLDFYTNGQVRMSIYREGWICFGGSQQQTEGDIQLVAGQDAVVLVNGCMELTGTTPHDIPLLVNGCMVINGATSQETSLVVCGSVEVTGDVVLSNADCAEEFDVADMDSADPGTVMVIDANEVLRPSYRANDKRVAGVVSGAGDLRPGIVLGKQSGKGARLPIALTGKVYCKVDAQYAAVEVGDLLTTSPTPGHAMKAADPAAAFGAVIGKALGELTEGTGLIPMLVALQ